jgi:uncharacterized Tic20 family protein
MTEEITQGGASQDDRTLAMITHLSGIVASFVMPLIIWLINKDRPDKGFLVQQSKEALNFQITVVMAWLVAGFLSILLVGFLLYPVIFLGNVVFCILAGLQANKGDAYRYPVAVRLIN